MKINIQLVERKLGYTFQNKELLIQALTHSSFAYENQEQETANNEVLEFLGDSVLGFIVAAFLYSQYPGLSEGELSKLKSSAASTSALYLFAKKIRLEKQIRLGKGEEKSGGRNKKTILAGTFEAVIAALYLDGGLEKTSEFLLILLQPLFKKIDVDKFIVNNLKSALQEYLQQENLPAPIYKTVTTKGPDHRRVFVVEVFSQKARLAHARGLSKKDAEQKAAQKALKILWGRKVKALTNDTFLEKKEHD